MQKQMKGGTSARMSLHRICRPLPQIVIDHLPSVVRDKGRGYSSPGTSQRARGLRGLLYRHLEFEMDCCMAVEIIVDHWKPDLRR